MLSSACWSAILLVAFFQSDTSITPDSEFKGVTPPDWVLEGSAKVFVSLDDSAGIDQAAEIGATIIHAGGPAMYYPLHRDNTTWDRSDPERKKWIEDISHAKAKGMRVVLGISPYAPIEFVNQHPEWVFQAQNNNVPVSVKARDLASPEFIHLRSLPLHTPYGDYAIECLTEIMQELGADGFSFDGCYHQPINFSEYERRRYREETIAIHGITLRVQGITVQTARAEPGGLPLTLKRDGDAYVISVPALEIHTAIVLE